MMLGTGNLASSFEAHGSFCHFVIFAKFLTTVRTKARPRVVFGEKAKNKSNVVVAHTCTVQLFKSISKHHTCAGSIQ